VFITEFWTTSNQMLSFGQKQSLLITPFETKRGSAECHLSAFEDVKNGVMIG
jgi:hypothetical protein